jgi:ribosome-interacting GTPase 1
MNRRSPDDIETEQVIETLEAEVARLREALERIARFRTELSGDFSLGSKQSEIARAALEGKP